MNVDGVCVRVILHCILVAIALSASGTLVRRFISWPLFRPRRRCGLRLDDKTFNSLHPSADFSFAFLQLLEQRLASFKRLFVFPFFFQCGVPLVGVDLFEKLLCDGLKIFFGRYALLC